MAQSREERLAQRKAYREQHPEIIREQRQRYYASHKEECRVRNLAIRRKRKEREPGFRKAYQAEYYQKNKEKIAERSKTYVPKKTARDSAIRRGEFGEEKAQQFREYHNEYRRNHGPHARIVELLGGKCTLCGYDGEHALQVDHVNGGGTQERKGFKNTYQYEKHVLENLSTGKYQLLCANCNWEKRHREKEHRYRYEKE